MYIQFDSKKVCFSTNWIISEWPCFSFITWRVGSGGRSKMEVSIVHDLLFTWKWLFYCSRLKVNARNGSRTAGVFTHACICVFIIMWEFPFHDNYIWCPPTRQTIIWDPAEVRKKKYLYFIISLWLSNAIWRHWVNIGSGNGRLPNGSKPLPEPIWQSAGGNFT